MFHQRRHDLGRVGVDVRRGRGILAHVCQQLDELGRLAKACEVGVAFKYLDAAKSFGNRRA